MASAHLHVSKTVSVNLFLATVMHSHPAELGRSISKSLPRVRKAILDGEIVCVDRKGHPQFKDLLFHKGNPCFFAFDLLHDGKDRRLDAWPS
jgi:ATP-dependent DNA ligase